MRLQVAIAIHKFLKDCSSGLLFLSMFYRFNGPFAGKLEADSNHLTEYQ